METRIRPAQAPLETSAASSDPSPPAPTAVAGTLADPPRRRALKRKNSSLNSILSPAPPPKRLIKERNALNIPSLHNGRWTRATRHSPVKSATAASATFATEAEVEMVDLVEEEEEEEEVVDVDFEMVRSRGREVHVIPTPAGWFSWTKVHPTEKHTLTSFFNGNSENRTLEMYMEIRNSIMRKFHSNPQTQLELKDLEEISVSDSDAKQEVLEFLDHWGLINFHPFPPENPDVSNLDDEEDKAASLLEKFYQFETVQQCPRFVTKKVGVSIPPAMPPESSIAEELVWPVGPSVEYHCNSCSADCSCRRYHCQKQADFDLCTECYKNEKFSFGMASSDFILMESAKVPGVSGGSWTDQETLLLLEALELFSENWNEIAEHVATKTKAQCILHFLHMPIEDPFLEGGNDIDDNIHEQGDPDSANRESTALEVPVTKEIKHAKLEDEALSMPDFTKKKTDVTKERDASEVDVSCENGVNIAIDALKTAFQAVGYMPEQEELSSFANTGNPVMALAAFLTRLVEPDAAATSFRSSLKAMSEDSPNVHLATRHCFILEDPPNNKNDLPALESAATDTNNVDVPKGQDEVPVANGNDELKGGIEKTEGVVHVKNEGGSSMANQQNLSIESETMTQDSDKKPSTEIPKRPLVENEKSPCVENENSLIIQNGKAISLGDEKRSPIDNGKNPSIVIVENQSISFQDCLGKPSAPKESSESVLPSGSVSCNNKDLSNPTLPGEQIGPNAGKDGCYSDSSMVLSSTNPNFSEAPSSAANEINDLKAVCEHKSDFVKDTNSLASVDITGRILDPPIASNTEPFSEGQESKQKVVTDSAVECAEIPDKDDTRVSPSNKGTNDYSMETNDVQNNHGINRLKRAAVTVLSAAAVKAKLLANQEEDHIRQLVSLIIEKQLLKLEVKLAIFTDIGSVILRMREQTERSRHRLMHERAQIIAARLGLPASARANPPPVPPNKSLVGSIPPPMRKS